MIYVVLEGTLFIMAKSTDFLEILFHNASLGRIVTCPTYLDEMRIYRFNEKIKILLNYLVSFP